MTPSLLKVETESLILMESPRSFPKPMLWLDYSFTLFIHEQQNNWIQDPCTSLFFLPKANWILLNWTSCLTFTGYTNYPTYPHPHLPSRYIFMFLYFSLTTRRLMDVFCLCWHSCWLAPGWVQPIGGNNSRPEGKRAEKGHSYLFFFPSPLLSAASLIAVSFCNFTTHTHTSPFLQDFSSFNSAHSTFSPHSFSPKGMDISPLLPISQCLIFFVCTYNPLCK